MAGVERILNVARKVGAMRDKGNDMVVILSAMAGETDRLLNLARQITSNPSERPRAVTASNSRTRSGVSAMRRDPDGTNSCRPVRSSN